MKHIEVDIDILDFSKPMYISGVYDGTHVKITKNGIDGIEDENDEIFGKIKHLFENDPFMILYGVITSDDKLIVTDIDMDAPYSHRNDFLQKISLANNYVFMVPSIFPVLNKIGAQSYMSALNQNQNFEHFEIRVSDKGFDEDKEEIYLVSYEADRFSFR